MKLQDLVPKLGELALSVYPITRPYAKFACWSLGLGITIWAGTSIRKHQTKNRSKKQSNLFVETIGGTMGIAVLFVPINNEAKLSFEMGLAATTIAGVFDSAKSDQSESTGEQQNSKPNSNLENK